MRSLLTLLFNSHALLAHPLQRDAVNRELARRRHFTRECHDIAEACFTLLRVGMWKNGQNQEYVSDKLEVFLKYVGKVSGDTSTKMDPELYKY
jgi:hypothetical protein